jgi:nitroreductase
MIASETDHAITSRLSVRAFLPTPVPLPVIEAILNVAARALSGTNMQPWRGHVLIGAEKTRCATPSAPPTTRQTRSISGR